MKPGLTVLPILIMALCAPVLSEGGKYAATSMGKLHARQVAQAKGDWTVDLPAMASQLTRLPGRRLLVAHRGGKITAWSETEGTPLWESEPGKAAERVFVGNEDLVFSINGVHDAFWDEFAELLAMQAEDGKILWRLEGHLGGTIRLAGDRVVLVDGDLKRGFRVLAVSAKPGTPSPAILANVLRLEALDQAGSRQREVAIGLLKRAIQQHESPDFWYDLSRLYLDTRDFDRAQDAAVQGKDIEGADGEAFDALLDEIEKEVDARIARREAAAEVARKAAEEIEGGGEDKEGGEEKDGGEDGDEKDDPPGDDDEEDGDEDDPP